MNEQPRISPSPPASLALGDVLFILFRHKWKIISFSLLGLIGAVVIWVTDKPVYKSRATILVRYVAESRSPFDIEGTGDVIRSPDSRGASVVASEVAILESIDGMRSAAQFVTPARILASSGGGTNINEAVVHLAQNLEVNVPKNSSVINVSLKHRDPEVAREALDSIIKSYFRKHLMVHRSPEGYADLQQQTESLRVRLIETEEELRRLKNSAEVISLPEAKAEITSQLSDVQKRILETEAQLAERRAFLENHMGRAPTTSATNHAASAGVAYSPGTNAQLSSREMEDYAQLAQKLIKLRAAEADLLLTYTAESRQVDQVRQQIARTEQALANLGIPPEMLPKAPASVGIAAGPLFDPNTAYAEIASLMARYQTLTNQYAKVRERAVRLDSFENRIIQLQRRKDLEETQYTFHAKSLEQARLDQALDATKLTNISVIQEPTLGSISDRLKAMKIAGGVLAAALALGIGIAFLIDLVFDRTIKRAREIDVGLHLPVLAAFPNFGRNGHSRLKSQQASVSEAHKGTVSVRQAEIAPWDEADPMLPYYEAVRDRLVMSYGEDPHKPKIVGITSCHHGAGVTRISTGLAAALSRDAQRDVLLITLERNKVTIAAFAKGQPSDRTPPPDGSIDPGAEVAQNLYSLATTGRSISGASVVQSFSDLMPRLKTSDYDYILFDLPPLSQTSGSIRLASQMERTVLVVEAEKTPKHKVAEAKALFHGSKARLSTVLNRAPSYGPAALLGDS